MNTEARISPEVIKTFDMHKVRDPLKATSEEWQETAHQWYICINGISSEYYTGIGHRTEKKNHWFRNDGGFTYRQLTQKNLLPAGLARLLGMSNATPPSLDDILCSLISDSQACSISFDDWCCELGYDQDSRKAFSVYESCHSSGKKLKAMQIGSLAELQALYEGY